MAAELPPAIIFDMDDTILSDDAVSDRCWEQVCQEFADEIGGLNVSADVLLTEIRQVRRWYWDDPARSHRGSLDLVVARREILTLAFDNLDVQAPELSQEIVDVYLKLKSEMVQPFPGALDTLVSIGRSGVKLGLISNGNAAEQRAKVRRAGLEPLFKHILIGGEFGIAKPDPRVFLHTLEKLDVEGGDAWMVGDNLVNDVEGAQAVGIYGIWVDWRNTGLPDDSPVRPDRIIRSIVELVN